MNTRVAIFDDNIADRRHTERLLARESARLHSDGKEGYQTDCLGSTDKLLLMPEIYEIFVIDHEAASLTETCTDKDADACTDSRSIVRLLRSRGISQPVVLRPEDDRTSASDASVPQGSPLSEADKAFAAEMGNVFYLRKPHTAETLLPVIEECLRHIVREKGRVELRTEKETLYVAGDEILYAVQEEMDFLTVALKGRDPVRIRCDIPTLYTNICNINEENPPVPLSNHCFVNRRAVQKLGPLYVRMCDGRKLKVSPSFAVNLRELKKTSSVL